MISKKSEKKVNLEASGRVQLDVAVENALDPSSLGEGVTPGTVIAQKYRVDRVLGEGGMGIVVEARHLQLDQRVAIKFLRGDQSEDSMSVMRFRREARAAAKVQSDHVAHVFDVGSLEDGTRYLVMEYLEGVDLGEELEKRGRLAVGQSCSVALQALDALQRAHEVGIVHRDLKPENLFLMRQSDGTRRVKLVDFGISKLKDTGGSLKLTSTSQLMGTPLYMSPEQMATPESVDHRADIWSLGCVIYEMLSGRLPFEAQSIPEICMKVMGEEPPHLCDVAPDIPRDLGDIVMMCLRADVDERIDSAARLAALLEPYVAGSTAPSRSWVPGRVTGVMPVARSSAAMVPSLSQARLAETGAEVGAEQGQRPSITSPVPAAGVPATTLVTPPSAGLSETSDPTFLRPRSRLLPWVAGLLLGVAVMLGAAAFGWLPASLSNAFVSEGTATENSPMVGTSKPPEAVVPAEVEEPLVKEPLAVEPSEVEPETPNVRAPEKAPPRVVRSAPAPIEKAPVSTFPKAADSPVEESTTPAATPPKKKKSSVVAPYDEYAEFGGRR